MAAVLGMFFEAVARLVAPPRCAACDGSVRYGTAFCVPCAASLVPAPNLTEARVAGFLYGGAVSEAIRRFKFDDRPDLAPALLAGLGPQLSRLRGARLDLVVPVPLHPARLVERGYNQAALLARPLATWLGIPCATRALARSVATARQTDLSRDARAANVRRAFEPRGGTALSGRTILLVDDVETTGSTLRACADALEVGGARTIWTVVIARADGSRND